MKGRWWVPAPGRVAERDLLKAALRVEGGQGRLPSLIICMHDCLCLAPERCAHGTLHAAHVCCGNASGRVRVCTVPAKCLSMMRGNTFVQSVQPSRA